MNQKLVVMEFGTIVIKRHEDCLRIIYLECWAIKQDLDLARL
jgi:hypothetical protein